MRTQRTSELDCRLGRLIVVVVVALLAASVARVETQGAGDLLTIGIFPFQDESGSGVPKLAPGVAQMVRHGPRRYPGRAVCHRPTGTLTPESCCRERGKWRRNDMRRLENVCRNCPGTGDDTVRLMWDNEPPRLKKGAT